MMSCVCVLAMIYLCAHIISVVLLLFLYALCDLARYLLILSSDLFMKILEIIFLITSSRVIGRRFFTGLRVFFSFGSGSNTPVPSFTSALVVSNIPFSTLLISWWTSSGAYLISSTLMLSFPGALLLANFCNAFVTSFWLLLCYSTSWVQLQILLLDLCCLF